MTVAVVKARVVATQQTVAEKVGQRKAVAERVVVVARAVVVTARVGEGRQMAAEAMATEEEVVTVHSVGKGLAGHNHHNQHPMRSGCTQILAHRHHNHCRLCMGNGGPIGLIGCRGQEVAAAVAWDMGYSSTPVSSATAPRHRNEAGRKEWAIALARRSDSTSADAHIQSYTGILGSYSCRDPTPRRRTGSSPSMRKFLVLAATMWA